MTLLDDLQQALAKAGTRPRKARDAMDLLLTSGPELLVDPTDRATWQGIVDDAPRLRRLLEEARTADAAWVRQALQARVAARAAGHLPPAWRPPRPLTLTAAAHAAAILLPPWLEAETATAAAVRAVVVALATAHPLVAAIVLYGSMARHEARHPREDSADATDSDVDLLALVQIPQAAGAPAHQAIPEAVRRALWQAEMAAVAATSPAVRDLQVLASPQDLAHHWDALFIETVDADGILLWARCPLPPALAAVAERAGVPCAPAAE